MCLQAARDGKRISSRRVARQDRRDAHQARFGHQCAGAAGVVVELAQAQSSRRRMARRVGDCQSSSRSTACKGGGADTCDDAQRVHAGLPRAATLSECVNKRNAHGPWRYHSFPATVRCIRTQSFGTSTGSHPLRNGRNSRSGRGQRFSAGAEQPGTSSFCSLQSCSDHCSTKDGAALPS